VQFGGTATRLTEFDDPLTELDPAFTGDPDELVFTRTDVSARKHIVASRKIAATGTYGVAVPLALGGGAQDEDTDPALTKDGLNLMFLSSRDNAVFEATRAPGDLMFGTPGNPIGLPSGVSGLDLSADGLAVYFHVGNGALSVARRNRRTESFGVVTPLGFTGEFPSISANNTGMIVRRRRDDLALAFNAEEPITPGNDPEVSPDGRSLMFAADNTLFLITRECP
jgi:WD40-like Beta Propeller Repeat